MSQLRTLKSVLDHKSLPADLREHLTQQYNFLKRVEADERAFQHLGGRLDCGLVVVDERGVMTYVNDRLAEVLRAPRSTLVGEFVAGWLWEKDRPVFFRQFSMRRTKGSSTPYRLRCRRADDSVACLSVVPFPRFDERAIFRGTFAMIFEVADEGLAEEVTAAAGSPSRASGPSRESSGASMTATFGLLSPREREIVEILLAGREVSEVAEACGITPHTVRNHIKAIYRKVGVHSRAALVRRFVDR